MQLNIYDEIRVQHETSGFLVLGIWREVAITDGVRAYVLIIIPYDISGVALGLTLSSSKRSLTLV